MAKLVTGPGGDGSSLSGAALGLGPNSEEQGPRWDDSKTDSAKPAPTPSPMPPQTHPATTTATDSSASRAPPRPAGPTPT
jgi:hypothetical protein